MTLPQFPPRSRMCWRRIDMAGREEACFEQTLSGWHVAGDVDVEESGIAAAISYRIECDPAWCTASAVVRGEVAGKPFELSLAAAGGRWTKDGRAAPELDGALDVDLGFTPATNTLPIRRLQLAVGETAPVISAWLRFPELRVETLAQKYTRKSARVYQYVAQVDGSDFAARLETDRYGRVIRYEGLWEAESATPA